MIGKKEVKKPSILYSIATLTIVLTVIVVGLLTGIGPQMSIFYATVCSIVAALALNIKWEDLQTEIIQNTTKSITAMLILIFVGVLVGIWTVGGTLPSLIYYGLKVMSPNIIVPCTFLLCALTSVFTGTSFGSIATMGLVLFSVGVNMGVPAPLLAGAVVSGACFGDKMSPMSDTTNLASTMAGVELYDHIGSMLYTTLPATIVALVIYTVLGMPYGAANVDTTNINLILETLESNFNISLVAIIPLIILLVLAMMKVPAILAMGLTTVISIFFAMGTQGTALASISKVALSGYVSNTGISTIDTILSRGGISSMLNTIVLIFFASAMGGALIKSGVLKVLIDDGIMKIVKTRRGLVLSNMAYCYSLMLMTGNQTVGIVLPGQTLAATYDKMDTSKKVLSRTLEDTATISGALIPWSSFFLYVCSVLPVGAEYIPFALLNYIVPIFSILCAITGFGIWNSKNESVRLNHKPAKNV